MSRSGSSHRAAAGAMLAIAATFVPEWFVLAAGDAGRSTAMQGAADTQARAAQPAASSTSPQRTLGADDLKGLAWRSVGPATMGGRVSAIALVPGSRTSFYVGYGTGGVFKTDNLGVTFQSVFDEYAVLSIGALAVADAPPDWRGWAKEKQEAAARGESGAGNSAAGAPSQAKAGKATKTGAEERAERGKGKIVWVGTGEGNNRNTSSWGNGVYRSTDGGATFQHLGLAETHDIPSLALDPRDPDVCYVAALGHWKGAFQLKRKRSWPSRGAARMVFITARWWRCPSRRGASSGTCRPTASTSSKTSTSPSSAKRSSSLPARTRRPSRSARRRRTSPSGSCPRPTPGVELQESAPHRDARE